MTPFVRRETRRGSTYPRTWRICRASNPAGVAEPLNRNWKNSASSPACLTNININSFGDTLGVPFQVHIGKRGKKSGGSARNLIDVGYGR